MGNVEENDEVGTMKLVSIIVGCVLALVVIIYLSVKVHGYLEESIEKETTPNEADDQKHASTEATSRDNDEANGDSEHHPLLPKSA